MALLFKHANGNEVIEENIYLENDDIVIENITSKTLVRIKIDEVKKYREIKNGILLSTVYKEVVYFPKAF